MYLFHEFTFIYILKKISIQYNSYTKRSRTSRIRLVSEVCLFTKDAQGIDMLLKNSGRL